MVVWSHFRPFGSGLVVVFRLECNTVGSSRDIADASPSDQFDQQMVKPTEWARNIDPVY